MSAPAVGAMLLLALLPVFHASASSREPARLQVTAREFSFALSRQRVSAGPVVIELVNLGEDDHDLALRRTSRGATTRRIHTTGPAEVHDLETRLREGRYLLWCTLADHRARGMSATFVVGARG